MPRGVTGPFDVAVPGGSYFTILPPEIHLLNGYRMLLNAREAALRNFPGADGRARALAIDVVLKETQRAVDAAAALTAVEAEKLIVAKIKSTQVRPDPPGSSGRGVRLQDAIECRPIRTSVAGGGVGIGAISLLDKVADKNGQAYWRAQEFGSAHMVGRTIHGFFQPGKVSPDPAKFRTHPVFGVEEGGAEMTINRPIPERAFLREGAAEAERFRQKALGDAVTPSLAELRLIQSGTHPRLKAARSYLKGKRAP